MLKFKCTNEKCQKCCEVAGEEDDNRLRLVVEEKHYQKFDITKDGQLEYYDSDCDQVIFLECPVCEAKYEFDIDEDKFMLQLEKKDVVTKFNLMANNTGCGDVINLNDYEVKRKE